MSEKTPHQNAQQGKGLNVNFEFGSDGLPAGKCRVIVGDEEKIVDAFNVVATWIKPKSPDKPTYAYPVSMILKTLNQQGVRVETLLDAVRIHVKSIYRQCSELKIYDNRPDNPFELLAWYQNGKWIPMHHPDAKKLSQ